MQVKYRLDDESLREGKFRIDESTGILFTRIGFEEDVGLSYSLTVREPNFFDKLDLYFLTAIPFNIFYMTDCR